jgi:hypothetical protein
VTANVLFEKTKDLSRNLIGARTPDHDAVSVAFEYLPTFPLKASVKGEYAGSDNTKRIGLVYAIAGRLFDRMSLLARGSYYRDAGEQSLASTRGLYVFGIAYRPTADNWLNLLGQIELRTEGNQIVQPAVGYRSVVGWAHASIVPFAGAEIGVKYALKSALEHAGEFDIRTLTDLIQGRVQYDVASFLNVAVEGRMLRQYEVGDRRLGWSAEAGVVVLPNLMLVGGYNFEGYAERDLIDNVYSAAGPYVTVRAKFTERLFGFGD